MKHDAQDLWPRPGTVGLASRRSRGRVRAAAAGPLWLLVLAWLAACPSKPAPPARPGEPTSDDLINEMRKSRSGGGGGGSSEDDGGGCAPAPVEVFLQAEETLNPNDRGQSMPVEVRVLLLRERDQLDQMDFETVWQDSGAALGRDLVKSASLTVFPGKLKIHPMKSSRSVGYVALVGIFRRPEGRSWQYVVDVREQNRRCASGDDLHTIVHARLRDNRITKP